LLIKLTERFAYTMLNKFESFFYSSKPEGHLHRHLFRSIPFPRPERSSSEKRKTATIAEPTVLLLAFTLIANRNDTRCMPVNMGTLWHGVKVSPERMLCKTVPNMLHMRTIKLPKIETLQPPHLSSPHPHLVPQELYLRFVLTLEAQ
jgi:hypothetical protein